MQILIGCAKDMSDSSVLNPVLSSRPMFYENAVSCALQMAGYGEEELIGMLGCNMKIARQNRLRYLHFADSEPALQAILAYTGIVYKYMGISEFADEDFAYAQEHLWITSFLYGLLRPMDRIKSYRLEGNVVLPDNGVSMFDYWKSKLTDVLINSVKNSGGILLDIASSEMRRLFDWRKVACEVRVLRPEFYVRKGDVLKTIVVYSKMCRGAMCRYAITNRVDDDDLLKNFTFEGFCHSVSESKGNNPVFILE